MICNWAASIQKNNEKECNVKLALFKVFLMIMVVCSHTQAGGYSHFFQDWFPYYSFFIDGFVFASGYFYSTKSEEHVRQSVYKKIKSLLLPYFFWNIFYGILVAVFKYANIINFGQDINFRSIFIEPWIGGHQFLFNCPAWFIPTLFIITISYLLVRVILRKLCVCNDIVLLFGLFAISYYSIYMAEQGYKTGIYLTIFKAGAMVFIYHFGYIYKTYLEKFLSKYKIILLMILVGIRYISLVFFGGYDLNYQVVWLNYQGNSGHIILTKVIGILFFITICEILAPAFQNSNFIKFFSNNTFTVMMHHLTVMFGINLILYLISERIHELKGFDVATFRTSIYYQYLFRDQKTVFFYLIIGIIIPLFIKFLYERGICKLAEKLSFRKK